MATDWKNHNLWETKSRIFVDKHFWVLRHLPVLMMISFNIFSLSSFPALCLHFSLSLIYGQSVQGMTQKSLSKFTMDIGNWSGTGIDQMFYGTYSDIWDQSLIADMIKTACQHVFILVVMAFCVFFCRTEISFPWIMYFWISNFLNS